MKNPLFMILTVSSTMIFLKVKKPQEKNAMKKYCLLIFVIFYSCIANTLFADTDTDTGKKCIDITVHNKGAYILTVEVDIQNVCLRQGFGKKVNKSLDVGKETGFQMKKGAPVNLSAAAGSSTVIWPEKSGKITCKGTTFIGFKCKLKPNSMSK